MLFADSRDQHFPRLLRYSLTLFDPSDVYALEAFNLMNILMPQASEEELRAGRRCDLRIGYAECMLDAGRTYLIDEELMNRVSDCSLDLSRAQYPDRIAVRYRQQRSRYPPRLARPPPTVEDFVPRALGE